MREARSAVRERLSGELPDGRLDDVELLVSELATNSVRHAAPRVQALDRGRRVRGLRAAAHVRRGDGFEEPATPDPHPHGTGGYGLVLLDRLADRWGVNRDGGFCVWFEIARPS